MNQFRGSKEPIFNSILTLQCCKYIDTLCTIDIITYKKNATLKLCMHPYDFGQPIAMQRMSLKIVQQAQISILAPKPDSFGVQEKEYA